ncbi:MAG: 16S rRNA (uracil(1498)-N(3))-methyltransferase [Candidatus Omnitrophota bacterium]
MNLILLLKEDLTASHDRVRLSGRRHKHIRNILKSSVGDELCVGREGSRIGRGRVLAIDNKTVEMKILLDKNPPLPLPLTLVLALPRPLFLRRVLIHSTILGVKKIILLHAKRVEKSYWESPALREEKIREQFILGLEQAKDTVMPEIHFRKKFKPFVEDELPGMIKGARAFVAHSEGDLSYPPKGDRPVILVIGPEGGFIPYEIEKLKKSGCRAVNFGERIMNVETAVVACISRLM